MFNRWVEDDGLLGTLEELGIGSIAFTPLAQGLLTNKYLNGVPEDSRARQDKSLDQQKITPDLVENLKALNDMAQARGQTLAQMAIAWVLRKGRITSALIGASNVNQVIDCAGAVKNMDFTDQELKEIDALSGDKGINLWAQSSETEWFKKIGSVVWAGFYQLIWGEMAIPAGLEPATCWLEVSCSIQLSYGTVRLL